ncbi:citrate synthase [Ornithinimicrobium cavernae]|uniref:citrate synthase n=1 Tax=Ornithinimicrobium cavernae TaxID=2666047 RepID=UPI001379D07E|nr:citrate synthase [Ornithinimicrobium cavernae]
MRSAEQSSREVAASGPTDETTGELTTGQVADYLGVKVQTVYAYVSRGVLTPIRREPGTGSLFRLGDVRALVDGGRSGRRGRTTAPRDDLRTTITEVTPGALAYRGHDITRLVGTHSFEEVRALLTGSPEADGAPTAQERAELTQLMAALPARTPPLDRFKHAVLLAATTDVGRQDRSPSAIARAGRRAALLMALTLPAARLSPEGTPTLAATLATALHPLPADLLDAVLVLLADHDLAVSTTAVRVAVSSGADAYSALLAGLAASDSPHHVAASLQAVDWLSRALRGPQELLDEALAGERPPPGFGHLVYTEQDPRAQLLLDLLRPDCPEEEWAVVRLFEQELLDRRGWVLNIDLAVALVVRRFGLPRHAGAAVFACARTAGWVAHAIEELEEPAMRFRLRGLYSGPRRMGRGRP